MTAAEIESLVATRANYVAQLLALSNPLKRKLSHSIGGRSMTWTEYQAFLQKSIADIDALIAGAGGENSPSYVVTAMD
jgi:hypothetical protein